MPIYLADFVISYTPSPTVVPSRLTVGTYVYSTEVSILPALWPIYKLPSLENLSYFNLILLLTPPTIISVTIVT